MLMEHELNLAYHVAQPHVHENIIANFVLGIEQLRLDTYDFKSPRDQLEKGGHNVRVSEPGLGAHKIHDAPRVVDGEIRVRKVMYLSCSIDHRIVDGAAGVRFLNVLARCLSDPRNLLLEA